MTIRKKILWGAAIAVIACIVIILINVLPHVGHHERDRPVVEKPPAPDDGLRVEPETYREMVAAFSTGVAALDADASDTAKVELTRATQLVPEEPAAWLNLGLAEIRLGEDDAAVRTLEKAKGLAPESAAADRLLGLLESRRGRPAEAIGHFRNAVEKDPGDVRSLFALAEEVERQGDEGSEAEIRRLIAQIVERKPENVAVLMQQARLAVKAQDVDALRGVIAKLKPLSAGWPERAAQQFRQVEESGAAGDLRAAAPRVTVLRNLLIAEPAFRASLAELQSAVGVVGDPVETFLKLPQPTPTPSPPDTALAFAPEPVGGEAAAAVAAPAITEGEPLFAVADGREVRFPGTERPPLAFPGGTEGTPPGPNALLAVDWNSDNLLDLVCAGAGGLRIYRGEADGSFADVTEATTLEAGLLTSAAAGAWTADIELDGDLDLVVGRQEGSPIVLRNNGDGTFATVNPFEGLTELRDLAWYDLDRNGLPDVAALDGRGMLRVFINERSGRYGPRAVPESPGQIRAFVAGDQNADGTIDLILLNQQGVVTRLSAGDRGDWRTAEIARWDALPEESVRLFLADLDNNGAVDLAAATAAQTRIWLGDGSARLSPLTAEASISTCSILDLNDDGRLDLAGLSPRKEPTRALNRGTKPYHWQAMRPRGAKVVGDGRINSFGVGGEIEVRSGLLVQRQVVTGPTVHFGLGERPSIDVARIVWPNGTVQAEFDVKVDQVMTAEQRLKGSCPFVYAYDGENVKFVTDFLWRSPLGLRINAQDTAGIAQTEDWIKIRGDQLAPRDGYYDIRLTAELWETHYWDHVSLMAVDHPAGTAIFVDERFARTPPALEVHATGPLMPVVARDDVGRDVSEIVREADGRYLDGFERGPYQGVAREHWVEVEIGDDVPGDRPLRFVAQGWVHPTDSSINVALAQGRNDPPQGLVLEVPAADGSWSVARTDLGFPAGKNKTVLIDLDGIFAADAPRKFRLRTNLEVFWDRLAVATAGESEQLRKVRIAPETADLRHRGYSLMTQADAASPELPHYEVLTGTAQRWRDLEGFYTRFGDVRELFRETDDRYVIANAGDEVRFLFPAPPPPPPGWARDFVLIGDGWNKDGDFNTAFSGTVQPLPSHGSTSYDVPPGDLEDDPVYRRHAGDWGTYHTRYVAPGDFQNGLRPRDR